jgi:hypothetical protein
METKTKRKEWTVSLIGDNGEEETHKVAHAVWQLLKMTSEERDNYKAIITENTMNISPNEQIKKHNQETITFEELEKLQGEVYGITGKGKVMMLFNKILGNSAG